MNGTLCRLSMAMLAISSGGVAAGHTQSQQQLSRPADYPRKPIRFLVGQAPGGGIDTISRVVAQKLTERLGSAVIVDNRAGAAGTIAAGLTAQAAADGYTILVASCGALATNMLLKKESLDIRKAYAPVALLSLQPYFLVVRPALAANSIKDFIAYAKSNPAKLSYGSTGVGSTSHLGMELLKSMAGIDLVHVSYKGTSPALIDVMSGQIQAVFGSAVAVIPNIKSGKLKALAVTSEKRMAVLPDLPALAESVPGYELSVSYGLFAPAGTPSQIVLLLNREAGLAVNTEEMKEKLAAEGAQAAASNSPSDFRTILDKDISKWEKFFKTTALKFD